VYPNERSKTAALEILASVATQVRKASPKKELVRPNRFVVFELVFVSVFIRKTSDGRKQSVR
jgi:hypothetical protein